MGFALNSSICEIVTNVNEFAVQSVPQKGAARPRLARSKVSGTFGCRSPTTSDSIIIMVPDRSPS